MQDDRQRPAILERLIDAQPPETFSTDAPRYSEAEIAAAAAQIGLAGNNKEARIGLQRRLALMQGKQAAGLFGDFGYCTE